MKPPYIFGSGAKFKGVGYYFNGQNPAIPEYRESHRKAHRDD